MSSGVRPRSICSRELPLGQKSVPDDLICRFQQIKLNVLFVYRVCLFCDKAPVLKSFQ